MRNLIQFLIKYHVHFVYLLFFTVSGFLLLEYNYYQQARFFNTYTKISARTNFSYQGVVLDWGCPTAQWKVRRLILEVLRHGGCTVLFRMLIRAQSAYAGAPAIAL